MFALEYNVICPVDKIIFFLCEKVKWVHIYKQVINKLKKCTDVVYRQWRRIICQTSVQLIVLSKYINLARLN